jgi:hypothetical protein
MGPVLPILLELPVLVWLLLADARPRLLAIRRRSTKRSTAATGRVAAAHAYYGSRNLLFQRLIKQIASAAAHVHVERAAATASAGLA